MRTETITRTTYTFDELSDAAKEKARAWYREGNLDYEWWNAVYEDAKTCGALIGIDIRNIWFSGFSSQGDGACFAGSYSYVKGSVRKIMEHAPKDEELHRIARALAEVQKRYFYSLSAFTEHSGHYYHSGCMNVEVSTTKENGTFPDYVEAVVTQLLRDFADWIYSQLEMESDWLESDESVNESIRSNGYEFLENGEIA